MKKTEKIIAAVSAIALGVLLIVLQGQIISILMTVLGVVLIALGVMDLINKLIPPAVVKLVAGLLVVVCGWVIVSAVLYVVAAGLIIAGILLLYEKIKCHVQCTMLWQTICQYAKPAVFLIIGLLLLFHQGETVSWVFVVSGICTVLEGGLLLVDAIIDD